MKTPSPSNIFMKTKDDKRLNKTHPVNPEIPEFTPVKAVMALIDSYTNSLTERELVGTREVQDLLLDIRLHVMELDS